MSLLCPLLKNRQIEFGLYSLLHPRFVFGIEERVYECEGHIQDCRCDRRDATRNSTNEQTSRGNPSADSKKNGQEQSAYGQDSAGEQTSNDIQDDPHPEHLKVPAVDENLMPNEHDTDDRSNQRAS